MSENKKTWDEKIKLILGELEDKIKAQEAESIGQRKRRYCYSTSISAN
ncbi:MAG: hypothetical protein NC318_13200 [Blautia sp.]|nr:hypothetical protein [Lachnoclostridium sp.]MCM1212545.1 hypothetical protein [Blautia sp.]